MKEKYTLSEVESPVKMSRISVVNGQNKVPGADKGHKQALQDKRFNFLNVKRAKTLTIGSDLVMIGDINYTRQSTVLAGHRSR